MEIRTPKLIPGESEGGAGVFTTDYFGRVREAARQSLSGRLSFVGGLSLLLLPLLLLVASALSRGWTPREKRLLVQLIPLSA